jgi:hypothetical protein
MIDYFLKFPDEAAANALLFTPGEVPKFNFPGNVDVIGVIYRPTGNMLQSTMEGSEAEAITFNYPETAPLEGWHVNVRTEAAIPELEAYAVTPKTASRVWA